MSESTKVDLVISIVGWYFKVICFAYFISILIFALVLRRQYISSSEMLGRYEKIIEDLNVYQPILYVGFYFLGVGIGRKKEWARIFLLYLAFAGLVVVLGYAIYTRSFGTFWTKLNILSFLFAAIFFSQRKVKERFSWETKIKISSSG